MSGYQIPRTLWAHLGWGGRRVDPRDPPTLRFRMVQETPARYVLVDDRTPASSPIYMEAVDG